MNEWAWNPSTVQAMASLVIAAGLVITIGGIIFAAIHNRRTRNLQAILTISMDMRKRWESGWEKILRYRAPSMDLDSRHRGEVDSRRHPDSTQRLPPHQASSRLGED